MESGSIHCHVSNLSRKKPDGGERSAVATAAYISGQDLWNEREGKTSGFGKRKDVIFSELLLPEGAPEWATDREQVWNKVEVSARRRDARLAKTITAAITHGIPAEQWPDLLRAYAATFVKDGMIADIAIHEDGTGHNPHVHVMLTVHQLKPDGFGEKIANADHKAFVTKARTGWEQLTNQYLAAAGLSLRVDSRSFKARGLSQQPTQHRGPDRMERAIKRDRAQRIREEHRHMTSSDKRQAAEQAAQQQFKEHRVDEWFADKQAEIEQPWYETARQNAQSHARQQAPEPERIPVRDPEEQQVMLDYEQELLIRAESQPLNRQEQALRQAVQEAEPVVQEQLDSFILSRRMMQLRQADQQEMLSQLNEQLTPDQQARLQELIQSEPPLELDRPEVGPYGQVHSALELEAARQRMVQELEREDQPERER